MGNEFIEDELKIKKWWFRVFLVSIAFTLVTSTMHPDFAQLSKSTMFFGVGFACFYKFLFYYFGYLRKGTIFLTFALFLFAFGLGMQLLFFLFPINIWFLQLFTSNLNKINPIFLILEYLISLSFFYITLKLRKINQLNKVHRT
ncbi:MAG: hypothetical protein ACRDAI_06505 [Candidatus Rhabdochlamydia sp.]